MHCKPNSLADKNRREYVSKLSSNLGKLGKYAASATIAPIIIDQATKLVNTQLDKHKDYVKVPDVISLSPEEANSVLNQYGFKHSIVKLDAKPKYADSSVNQILKMIPKPGSSIDKSTFLKLYYVDSEIVDKSRTLAEQVALSKAEKKAKTKANIKKTVNKTADISTNLKKKLHFKKSKSDDE